NLTANQIYNRFRNQVPWINAFLRQYNIPQNIINQILLQVIEITLEIVRNNGQQPGDGWSNWESLGGVLMSAPAVASWQSNRLDVFARGTDQALYHIWWDGRWSNWESLGGILTSQPAAVSWRPDRIHVTGRATDNTLYHIRW